MPFFDADMVRVAIPDPVTLAGLIVAVILAEPVADNWTVPPKLFKAVTLTLEVTGLPAWIVTPVGAAIVKSGVPLVDWEVEYTYQPIPTPMTAIVIIAR